MKIVIIGGGCSGVVTAINAKTNKNEVTILERNDELLKKLLVTGNGRCNYYNENQSITNYHSNSSNITDFINDKNLNEVKLFFKNLGIIPKIKNNYYYPSTNQASTIKDALISQLKNKKIEVKTNYLVEKIEKIDNYFLINNEIKCDKLVISTGSFSSPKTGSDGMGYNFLKGLGHSITEVNPSLVPLISDMPYCKKLSGVRSDVKLSLYEDDKLIKEEQGELQLTDYGISGICTFNLSYYASIGLSKNKKEVVKVNFLPFIEENIIEWLDKYNELTKIYNIRELLEKLINKKIVDVILKVSGINGDKKYDNLDSRSKRILTSTITDFNFNITGTKGLSNGQVCSGGIPLEEIDNNFSSKKVKNLFITGELLDLTGDCGGYNLTICWISGIISGKKLGEDND